MDALPGRFREPLQKVAQELGVYLAFRDLRARGRSGASSKLGRADRAGRRILGVYRKTHLFPTERLIPPI